MRYFSECCLSRGTGRDYMLTSAISKTAVAFFLSITVATWYPGGGEFKCYEDYRCITDTSSPQYRLQQDAWTDAEGLRRVDGFYCIALGSAYGTRIGTKYLITLSTGVTFLAILGDQKADAHTVDGHTRDRNGAVIEFIVETEALPASVRHSGSVSSLGKFAGTVEKITEVKE